MNNVPLLGSISIKEWVWLLIGASLILLGLAFVNIGVQVQTAGYPAGINFDGFIPGGWVVFGIGVAVATLDLGHILATADIPAGKGNGYNPKE